MFDVARRDSDTIAVISLNNPPANALGLDQINELTRLLEGFDADERLRAVIFCSDLRFFSAGADISFMAAAMKHADGPDRVAELCRRMQDAFVRLERLSALAFVAISGICVGGGLELALACDFRIAEKSAVLGLPEVKIGLLPGAGGTQRLATVAGRTAATRFIMTGEMISGSDALEAGIIHAVTDQGSVFEETLQFARMVIAAPKASLAAIKRCMALAPSTEGFRAEIEETRALHMEPETRARIAAFLSRTEKKKVAV